jgi:hypothetical protein
VFGYLLRVEILVTVIARSKNLWEKSGYEHSYVISPLPFFFHREAFEAMKVSR